MAGGRHFAAPGNYLSVISKDTSLSYEEKLERIQAILFGWNKKADAPKSEKSTTEMAGQ